MSVTPIVLRENSITRLVFSPSWVSASSNPLRGGFRFQRKSPKETWEDAEHRPMSSLKKDEGYELNLDGSDIAKLFSGLEEVRDLLSAHGHHYGIRTFRLSQANAGGIFLQIGDIGNRDWVVEQLRALESQNFENLGAVLGLARLEKAIDEFEQNLPAPNNEAFWQKFFERNPWVLQQIFSFPVICLNGETYLGGKNSKSRQGSGGVVTDFLFKHGSSESLAVVEIKTPQCNLIGSCYRGCDALDEKNTVYEIDGELTGGIVQLENQLHVAVESFKTQLGDSYPDLNHLNPTGLLIAGDYSRLSPPQRRSFDLFRKSLGKNQIFTFDEVLAKLKLIRAIYSS